MFRLRTVVLTSTSCLAAGGWIVAKLYEYQFSEELLDFADLRKSTTPVRFRCNLPGLGLPTVEASSSVIPSPANVAPALVPPSSSRVSEVMRLGFPSLDNIKSYGDFVVSYDRRTRNANWVFEHITPDRLLRKDEEAVDRAKCQFTQDSSVHPYFRATNEDYKKSGYDRGHLAAAGNYRHSQTLMEQTFLLTNISPQVGRGFNRDIWNSLEKFVRAVARKNRNVYLCTGPLYLPQRSSDGKLYVKYEVIGKNHVAVPTHFFKVVVIETNNGDFEQLSFVMPNQVLPSDVPLKSYLVPLETIERAAGLLFLEKLPKNKLISINHSKK